MFWYGADGLPVLVAALMGVDVSHYPYLLVSAHGSVSYGVAALFTEVLTGQIAFGCGFQNQSRMKTIAQALVVQRLIFDRGSHLVTPRDFNDRPRKRVGVQPTVVPAKGSSPAFNESSNDGQPSIQCTRPSRRC
jgi:hypothetical protein